MNTVYPTPLKPRFFDKIGHALRSLLEPVWPQRCAVCDRTYRGHDIPVCLRCLARLPRLPFNLTIHYVGVPGNTVTVRSWFVYSHDDISHTLIHAIKYGDRRRLARKLGREFALHVLSDGVSFDIILPIPLHWTKQVERSYNQSAEIALGIKDVTGIRVAHNLYARRPHPSQTRRNGEERRLNVRDVFGVRRPKDLDGKHIAIVDDVFTTGATMFSAIDTIMAVSQPASITLLTLARTSSN